MKQHNLSHFFKIVPLALTLVLTMACGSKNKAPNSVPVGTTIMGIPNLPATTSAQIQQVISKYPCQSGARMPEIQLSTTSIAPQGNQTVIMGPYNPGSVGGTVGMVYIGKSAFSDILIITKMTNGGSQVTGFNVTVSMCQYSNLIIPGRPLSGFDTPVGIMLSDYSSCGLGNVTYAKTVMLAGPYQNLPQVQVLTDFSSVGCM